MRNDAELFFPNGNLLGNGLDDVPLCLPEQGRREVKRGVIVEQLARM